MKKIETKSGVVKISPRNVRKSVRNAHALIKAGLPGAVQGPNRYDPETDSIVECATGKIVGKLNRG
jgi:hypothetical protein